MVDRVWELSYEDGGGEVLGSITTSRESGNSSDT
jgi:hypothetical protein